jgi:hypothetical protein
MTDAPKSKNKVKQAAVMVRWAKPHARSAMSATMKDVWATYRRAQAKKKKGK